MTVVGCVRYWRGRCCKEQDGGMKSTDEPNSPRVCFGNEKSCTGGKRYDTYRLEYASVCGSVAPLTKSRY